MATPERSGELRTVQSPQNKTRKKWDVYDPREYSVPTSLLNKDLHQRSLQIGPDRDPADIWLTRLDPG